MTCLRDYCERRSSPEQMARRGDAHQRPERLLEAAARGHAVAIGRHLVEHGFCWREAANLLDLSPRTLRDWRHDRQPPGPPLIASRGRPVRRSSPEERNEVIHLIDEYGPAIGVPTLRDCCPAMPRAEIDELPKRYRRVWRRRHWQPIRRLHWHQPGRVWAIDFTGPLASIEGHCPYLLAVRDLVSGRQLLWFPVEEANARTVANALVGLFLIHGAPLVLKSDNGSPFAAAAVRQLTRDFGVRMLFSPPACPRYNGTIEAGIGALKTRTEQHAARHGRAGQWTFDDLAAARLEANATARPHGPGGPTPDQTWAERSRISAAERARFGAEVDLQRAAIAAPGRAFYQP